MKKSLNKLQKLPRRQFARLAALSRKRGPLLAIALFVGISLPIAAYAWIIYPSMSYTPVATGNYTTISWSAPTSDYCTIKYAPSSVSGHISGETCYTGGGTKGSIGGSGTVCNLRVNGPNGSAYAGPINGATAYTLVCANESGGIGSSQGVGSASITVTPTSCANSSFGSPWNGNSYLIYSGGQGSISNWYGRYCVRNYSGSAIYIPMATPTEWNNFAARASAIGIGITSY